MLGTAADKQTVLSRVAGVRLEHQLLIANEGWDENADLRGESPWHSTSEQTANQVAKDLPLLLLPIQPPIMRDRHSTSYNRKRSLNFLQLQEARCPKTKVL